MPSLFFVFFLFYRTFRFFSFIAKCRIFCCQSTFVQGTYRFFCTTFNDIYAAFFILWHPQSRHRVAAGTKHFLSFHSAPSEFNKTLTWHTYAFKRQKCRGLNVFECAYKPTPRKWKFYWNLISQSIDQFCNLLITFRVILQTNKNIFGIVKYIKIFLNLIL